MVASVIYTHIYNYMKEYTLLKDRQELIVKWKEPLLFVKLTICSDNVFGNILLLT